MLLCHLSAQSADSSRRLKPWAPSAVCLWRGDFEPNAAVGALALVFSERYVEQAFDAILAHTEAARRRLAKGEKHVTREELRAAHAGASSRAERAGDEVLLVDADYEGTPEAWLAEARERFPRRPGAGNGRA